MCGEQSRRTKRVPSEILSRRRDALTTTKVQVPKQQGPLARRPESAEGVSHAVTSTTVSARQGLAQAGPCRTRPSLCVRRGIGLTRPTPGGSCTVALHDHPAPAGGPAAPAAGGTAQPAPQPPLTAGAVWPRVALPEPGASRARPPRASPAWPRGDGPHVVTANPTINGYSIQAHPIRFRRAPGRHLLPAWPAGRPGAARTWPGRRSTLGSRGSPARRRCLDRPTAPVGTNRGWFVGTDRTPWSIAGLARTRSGQSLPGLGVPQRRRKAAGDGDAGPAMEGPDSDGSPRRLVPVCARAGPVDANANK